LQDIDRQRLAKKAEVERLDRQIARLKASIQGIPDRLAALHRLWRDQFQCRMNAATTAGDKARLHGNAGRFIEVVPSYCGDRAAFMAIWDRFAPSDRRIRLGRNWDVIGDWVFEAFKTNSHEYASPWEMLRALVDKPGDCGNAGLGEWLPQLKEHMNEYARAWEEIQLTRVPDAVDITLFRLDGTVAGRISDGSLSDGQRNTVALALLLAQPDGPLVIDQPEDELDSNFIFKDLIPLLRSVKNGRQIIMATHNANLPVNGDAELVYALEAQEGRGRPLAQGGLDQERVKRSVLDIMEGSEEAFRKRYEKYHF
ncbi:MAG: ATP-binding protein, partial [Pseudomonadota bacterium]|nr:ATP-binding protein [Pseudomonadota bacterium]